MKNLARFTFLVVDDDENDGFLVKRAFSSVVPNARVELVESCEQAICYLQGKGVFADREKFPLPGIVLVDSVLPCDGGLELVRWVRQEPELKRTVVIMFSGSDRPESIRTAYENGVNSYLQKPAGYEEMKQLVQCVCRYWLECSMMP